MPIQRRNYDALGPVVGPYTHSVVHQGVLYTSGMTAYGTESQTKDIEQQTKEIFNQLEILCLANNTSLDKLIKVTLFVSDMSQMALLRDTLFTVYKDHIPASSMIPVAGLFADDLSIEIEAIIGL